MTYCVTRCRAENDVTFRGWVTRMLMSRVLSVGSSMFGRWVIMAIARSLSASPLQVYPKAETQAIPRLPMTATTRTGKSEPVLVVGISRPSYTTASHRPLPTCGSRGHGAAFLLDRVGAGAGLYCRG